ncbi:MAG: methyltransferase domain-containing protein, partial [Candidatus Omnitrophota bacterium]|nr:methyltransferase domain-containing protein [Candidatus Omnitrophota bacterium]
MMLYLLLPLVYPAVVNDTISACPGSHFHNLDIMLYRQIEEAAGAKALFTYTLSDGNRYRIPVGFPEYALPLTAYPLDRAENMISGFTEACGHKGILQIISQDIPAATQAQIIGNWCKLPEEKHPQLRALGQAIMYLMIQIPDMSIPGALLWIKQDMYLGKVYTFTDYLRQLKAGTTRTNSNFCRLNEQARQAHCLAGDATQSVALEGMLRQSIDERPDFTDPYYELISLLTAQGRFIEAICYLDRLRLQKCFAPMYQGLMKSVLNAAKLGNFFEEHVMISSDLRFQGHTSLQWMCLLAAVTEAVGRQNVARFSFQYDRTSGLNRLYRLLPGFDIDDVRRNFAAHGARIAEALISGKTVRLYGIPIRLRDKVVEVDINAAQDDFNRVNPFKIDNADVPPAGTAEPCSADALTAKTCFDAAEMFAVECRDSTMCCPYRINRGLWSFIWFAAGVVIAVVNLPVWLLYQLGDWLGLRGARSPPLLRIPVAAVENNSLRIKPGLIILGSIFVLSIIYPVSSVIPLLSLGTIILTLHHEYTHKRHPRRANETNEGYELWICYAQTGWIDSLLFYLKNAFLEINAEQAPFEKIQAEQALHRAFGREIMAENEAMKIGEAGFSHSASKSSHKTLRKRVFGILYKHRPRPFDGEEPGVNLVPAGAVRDEPAGNGSCGSRINSIYPDKQPLLVEMLFYGFNLLRTHIAHLVTKITQKAYEIKAILEGDWLRQNIRIWAPALAAAVLIIICHMLWPQAGGTEMLLKDQFYAPKGLWFVVILMCSIIFMASASESPRVEPANDTVLPTFFAFASRRKQEQRRMRARNKQKEARRRQYSQSVAQISGSKSSELQPESLESVDRKITERLGQIRDLQAFAIATDVLGESGHFKQKQFKEKVLIDMLIMWMTYREKNRNLMDSGDSNDRFMSRDEFFAKVRRAVVQMRALNAKPITCPEDIEKLGLNILELPELSMCVDLLDGDSILRLNVAFNDLKFAKRLCFCPREDWRAFDIFFAYGPAKESQRDVRMPDGTKKSVKVTTVTDFEVVSPFAVPIGTAGDTYCFILLPNIRRVISQRAALCLTADKVNIVPEADFYEFISCYGAGDLRSYVNKQFQIQDEARELIEAHEIGHISAFSFGAVGQARAWELFDNLYESGDESSHKGKFLLLPSLFELLANLAPNGIYRKAQEIAKVNPGKAYRMLQYQRIIALGYCGNEAVTLSYHHKWELPILYSILNEPMNLKSNLDKLLDDQGIFERVNEILTVIANKLQDGELDPETYIDEADNAVDMLVGRFADLNTKYNYRFNHFRTMMNFGDGAKKFNFPFYVDLAGGLPGHWDEMLVTGADRVMQDGDELLDMACGYGMVSTVLAHRAKRVVGCDISTERLKVAGKNIELNRLANVELRQGDIFDPVKGEQFDVITCSPASMPTPPGHQERSGYIALAHEGGPDGRGFIDKLIPQAAEYLKPGGRFVLVHMDFLGMEKTFEMLRKTGLNPEVLLERGIEVMPGGDVSGRRKYIEDALGYRFIEKDERVFYKTTVIVGRKPPVECAINALTAKTCFAAAEMFGREGRWAWSFIWFAAAAVITIVNLPVWSLYQLGDWLGFRGERAPPALLDIPVAAVENGSLRIMPGLAILGFIFILSIIHPISPIIPLLSLGVIILTLDHEYTHKRFPWIEDEMTICLMQAGIQAVFVEGRSGFESDNRLNGRVYVSSGNALPYKASRVLPRLEETRRSALLLKECRSSSFYSPRSSSGAAINPATNRPAPPNKIDTFAKTGSLRNISDAIAAARINPAKSPKRLLRYLHLPLVKIFISRIYNTFTILCQAEKRVWLRQNAGAWVPIAAMVIIIACHLLWPHAGGNGWKALAMTKLIISEKDSLNNLLQKKGIKGEALGLIIASKRPEAEANRLVENLSKKGIKGAALGLIIASKRPEAEATGIVLKLAELRQRYGDFRVSDDWILKILKNPNEIKKGLEEMVKEKAGLPEGRRALSPRQIFYLDLRLWLRRFELATVKELVEVFISGQEWIELSASMDKMIMEDRQLLVHFAEAVREQPIARWRDGENAAVGRLLLSLDETIRQETQRILLEASCSLTAGYKDVEYDAAIDLLYSAARKFNPYYYLMRGEGRIASYYTYVRALLQRRLVRIRSYILQMTQEERQAFRAAYLLKRKLIKAGTYNGPEQVVERLSASYPEGVLRRVLGLTHVHSLDAQNEGGFGMYSWLDESAGADTPEEDALTAKTCFAAAEMFAVECRDSTMCCPYRINRGLWSLIWRTAGLIIMLA